MTAQFYDRQDNHNPLNGRTVTTSTQLHDIMSVLEGRPPFFGELIGDNGTKLLLGIGPETGCVQFSAVDGTPPYLMAVSVTPWYTEDHAYFLIGNTPSPVPKRYIVTLDVMRKIAEYFIETGQRKDDIPWEEI